MPGRNRAILSIRQHRIYSWQFCVLQETVVGGEHIAEAHHHRKNDCTGKREKHELSSFDENESPPRTQSLAIHRDREIVRVVVCR